MTLFPVILPVVKAEQTLSGKEKVSGLSRISREALRLSAEKSGVTLGEVLKDEDDVPCPSDGNYWSVSHKPKCVAAVVSKEKIGIDIEEIKPRPNGIFNLVASDEEWALAGAKSLNTFFRLWTAKEAALKATGDGIGIGGLKACRVVSVPDANHIVMDYQKQLFGVEQFTYNNHIISVLENGNGIEWIIAGDSSYR